MLGDRVGNDFERFTAAHQLAAETGKPPARAAAGRVCATDDCTTRLSIYNLEERCAPCLHSEGIVTRCAGESE